MLHIGSFPTFEACAKKYYYYYSEFIVFRKMGKMDTFLHIIIYKYLSYKLCSPKQL